MIHNVGPIANINQLTNEYKNDLVFEFRLNEIKNEFPAYRRIRGTLYIHFNRRW